MLQSNKSPPNCTHWPQKKSSSACKEATQILISNIVTWLMSKYKIKIHKTASRRHMHWLSPETFFFNKMPSVFLIVTVFSSLQINECLFPALVPSEPSLSYFHFNPYALSLLPLCHFVFLSFWTPSPSPCLPRSPGSTVRLPYLFCMRDPWGAWNGRSECIYERCVLLRLSYSRGGRHICIW